MQSQMAELAAAKKPIQALNVLTFFEATYLKERMLKEDKRKHIINYISTFSKISGDKTFSEYKRGDIIDYVRFLENFHNSFGKFQKDLEKITSMNGPHFFKYNCGYSRKDAERMAESMCPDYRKTRLTAYLLPV